MKNILKYVFVLAIFINLANCTDDFENINTNPNGITQKSLTQMNNDIGDEFKPMFLNVFNTTAAPNYQLQQNLIGDVFSGYMTSPTPFAGNVNNMTYSLVDGWNGFPWGDAYGNIMPKVLKIKNTVASREDAKFKFFVYLANIIKVTAMHRVSDIYGPIRYSKFNDFKTTGEYDSQEVAYKAFFKDLTEAIDGLEPFVEGDSEESKKSSNQFKPFDQSSSNGKISMWRKFANSLRLRLAIRVSKIAPILAKTEGELALASNAGLMENTDMVINIGSVHPITTISGVWGDIRMGAEMESILTGYKDDRIKTYFNPAKKVSLNGAYKGIRMGIAITAKTQYGDYSAIGSVIKDKTLTWMTAAEVYFLKAEAALRGWNGAGDAKTNYENGVRASFTQHGASGVDAYLVDNTSTPADFVDAINPKNNIPYASDVKIAYNTAGTNEEQLEQIITQKWIAMF
ncbi:MAG: SusD/RagB family nutrient-binding outer membrane lipoprotein, partial [Polaribacter sp.]